MKQDAIALLDWDNTLRPDFTMPAWTAFLTGRRLFDAACHRGLGDVFAEHARGGVDYGTLTRSAVAWYGKGQPTEPVRNSARHFAAADREKLFGFTEPFIAALKSAGLGTRHSSNSRRFRSWSTTRDSSRIRRWFGIGGRTAHRRCW